ncbi:MAG TPA: serine hydrolase [Steroidobacteraceae bacterium]
MMIRSFAAAAPGCLLALGAFAYADNSANAGRASYTGSAAHAGSAVARDPQLANALPAIESTIKKSGAAVAVAFRTLDGKSEWLRRADESFHVASTMKVAVLIELYRQARHGDVRLDEPLMIRNEFHSLVDGSPFALDPQDDTETELYRAAGETRTLAQLSELMITVSSNLASNLLIDKLGVNNIRAGVHSLGADAMNVRRDLAVDRESSRQMIAILERQTVNDRIPAGLPPGMRVAHKTGEITGIRHDAAIVFAARPFVLVILTRGAKSPEAGSALIAEITRQPYHATR